MEGRERREAPFRAKVLATPMTKIAIRSSLKIPSITAIRWLVNTCGKLSGFFLRHPIVSGAVLPSLDASAHLDDQI